MSVQTTHLLHDSRFPLRKGNVTTRLVLDELDVNLPPLAAGLAVIVVVVVVVVDGATLGRAVGIVAVSLAEAVIEVRGRELVVVCEVRHIMRFGWYTLGLDTNGLVLRMGNVLN